jgi:hypothetical protein
MLDRGKIAVLSMIGVAAIMATFGWWWNYSRGQRCLAFYGSEAATLIRTAPKVEIIESTADGGSRVIDISQAPGLLNARTSLVDDASFLWNAPLAAAQSTNSPRVRFSRDQRKVILLFDFDKQAIRIESSGKAAKLDEKTSRGWRKFLDRHLKAS